MLWISFSDDYGNHLGDREMAECPLPGDSIDLVVTDRDPDGRLGEFDRIYRVGRRQWIPDCMPSNGKRIAALVLLERT